MGQRGESLCGFVTPNVRSSHPTPPAQSNQAPRAAGSRNDSEASRDRRKVPHETVGSQQGICGETARPWDRGEDRQRVHTGKKRVYIKMYRPESY